MMKENSPIWQKQKPALKDVWMSLPDINIPKVALNVLKIITTRAMTMTGPVYSTKISGLTSIPTETKNIAAKRFFIGVTSL